MYWTPSAETTIRAIEGVSAALDDLQARDDRAAAVKARLGDYRCQVLGVVDEGRREVMLNFVDRADTLPDLEEGDDPWDWRDTPIIVDDGGDAFWQAYYDPETGRFTAVNINGVA